VCAKVRHLQYKIRCLQYKISEITGICRGCTLPVFTGKYPAFRLNFSVKLLLFCVERTFACWGWLWLFSFASKQCFCDHKPWLMRAEKNIHPHQYWAYCLPTVQPLLIWNQFRRSEWLLKPKYINKSGKVWDRDGELFFFGNILAIALYA
jgi:hypothetical protein